VDEPVGKKELDKAKQYVKGKLILSMEDTEEVSHLLGKGELLKEGVKTLSEICAEVDKVTENDIHRVAKDLFREDTLRLAAIGPFGERRKAFEERLHF
jgi:predicted Zn-dependent peptidase